MSVISVCRLCSDCFLMNHLHCALLRKPPHLTRVLLANSSSRVYDLAATRTFNSVTHFMYSLRLCLLFSLRLIISFTWFQLVFVQPSSFTLFSHHITNYFHFTSLSITVTFCLSCLYQFPFYIYALTVANIIHFLIFLLSQLILVKVL